MVRLRRALLLLSASGVCLAQNRCFYPNGKNATNDFPCDPSAENSPCCGGTLGSVCLSNKLCKGPDGNLIRGSCTDKNWGAPECAQFCLGASTGGTDLISCTNVTRTDTSYCCDHTVNCCDTGVARFDVLPSNPQASATWDAKSSRFAVVLTTSKTSSATSSTPTLPTTSGSTDATKSTPNPSPNPNQSPDPAALSQTTTQGLSSAAQAGIGVGAAVGAILVAAVVWLLWRRKKDKAALGAGGTDQTMTSTNWQTGYYKPGGLPPPPQEMDVPSSRQEVEGHTWVELPANH